MLGNRSLKLKYLNPNMMLVATGVPDGEQATKRSQQDLTIFLIDTVTGQVLHRQTHQVSAAYGQAWQICMAIL